MYIPGSIRYHQPVTTLEEALFAARGTTNPNPDQNGTVHRRTQSAKVTREVHHESEHAEYGRRPYYQNNGYQG